MTIFGPPNFTPNAQFAFPRPYVEQFTFGFGVGAIFAHSAEQFFITDGTNPIVHVVCNLLPNFWATNSNRYTLDHVIVDWYGLVDPSPTPFPIPFVLRYQVDPVTIKPELFLFLTGWTTRYTFALPPPPADYWTPT